MEKIRWVFALVEWILVLILVSSFAYADKPDRLTKKGGIVTSPDGIVSIAVPAGVVSKNTKISIVPDYLYEGEVLSYTIETSKDIMLNEPLTVTFYLPVGSNPYARITDNGTEIYSIIDYPQGTISFEIDSFSKHRLAVTDPLQFINTKTRTETIESDTPEGRRQEVKTYFEYGAGAGKLFFNGDKRIAGFKDTYQGEYYLNNWGKVETNFYPQRTQDLLYPDGLGIDDLYPCDFMLFWEWYEIFGCGKTVSRLIRQELTVTATDGKVYSYLVEWWGWLELYYYQNGELKLSDKVGYGR